MKKKKDRKWRQLRGTNKMDVQHESRDWLYYFWRTPLSPLLRVILLQGSKLTLGLSRWHYPDSSSYFHSFPGIPSEPGNALHTTMQRRGFPFPSTALFSDQLHPLTFISSLPHPLLNWGFQVTTHPSKFSFITKITWYKSCSQDHSVHTLFLILSHSWLKTTPWARWTFCLICHSWSHTLSTLHNLLPPSITKIKSTQTLSDP